MKIKPNTDLHKFFNAVVKCEGSVTYQTLEGDEINLKSQLSQYFVAMAFYSKDLPVTGNVICANADDMPHLTTYLYE